jgi:acyl-CoA synthetase (AMP-forming)/AMP-acid ligase II
VGRPFDSIEWRIIRITDEPIATIDDVQELPVGEIGELVVRGPQASPRYVTRPECNAEAKIADESGTWHRMGDVGYFDDVGRFWYCGRKSQRVETQNEPLFTECVESLFNAHPAVSRSALVGIGPCGRQTPVVICQPTPEVAWCGGRPVSKHADQRLVRELRALAKQHPLTRSIEHFLLRDSLPVDVRHNAKINREQLAAWAATQFPELA